MGITVDRTDYLTCRGYREMYGGNSISATNNNGTCAFVRQSQTAMNNVKERQYRYRKWWDMSDLSDVLKVNVYLFPPLDWKISIKTSVMLGRKCPTMVFTWHRIIADINISRTFKRRRMMNSVLLITRPTINYTSSRYWAYW